MRSEMIRKVARIVLLAAATAVFIHILINDARSNWLAVIPGLIVVSAFYHFGRLAIAKRAA